MCRILLFAQLVANCMKELASVRAELRAERGASSGVGEKREHAVKEAEKWRDAAQKLAARMGQEAEDAKVPGLAKRTPRACLSRMHVSHLCSRLRCYGGRTAWLE